MQTIPNDAQSTDLPVLLGLRNRDGLSVHIEPYKTPPQGAVSDAETMQGLAAEEQGLAHKIVDKFGGGYDVSHSAPFWIIDRAGKIRASMDADALPSQIAANVRALMSR